MQVIEAHPLFPYFLEKCLAIPTSPFYIFLNGFCVTSFRTFFADPLYLPYIGGQYWWAGRNHNGASYKASQEPHFNPHSTAKPNDKAQISGSMVSSGISDVAFASVHPEKTHLKKLMIKMVKIIVIITEKPFTIVNEKRRCSRVSRLLNQKIQKFYMCSCMQYYYCIKEVRGNAGIGATGVFLCYFFWSYFVKKIFYIS